MKKSPENRDFGLGRGAFLDAPFSGLKGQTVNFRNWLFGFLANGVFFPKFTGTLS